MRARARFPDFKGRLSTSGRIPELNVEPALPGGPRKRAGPPRFHHVWPATSPSPCAVIALAGLRDNLRGADLTIVGSATGPEQGGRAGI